MMKLVIFASLFLLAQRCQGQGDVEVALSNHGLNFAARMAVDVLARDLNRNIPDMSQSGVDVKNIRITDFQKPSPSVTLNAGSGATLSLNDASIRAEANWSWLKKILFIKIRDSGTVTASSRASISLTVTVGISGGKPTISASGCSCSLADFSVKVGGTWTSFLYNLFISLFRGWIRTKLQNAICDAATKAVNNNGAQQLNSLNLQARINNFLTIDYSLARAPVFTSTFMKSYHKGKFLGDTANDVTPAMATPTDKMIAFSVCENVLNSGLRVLYTKDVVKYFYEFSSWSDIGGDIPFNADYGNGPFAVSIYTDTAPTARISAGALTVNLSCVVDIISKPPGQAAKTVLSLKFILTATAEASLSLNTLRGNVTNIRPSVTSITPAIPNFTTSQINQSIAHLINLVLPSINDRLATGMPLPTVYGVSFIQTSLTFNARYLTASANLQYTG